MKEVLHYMGIMMVAVGWTGGGGIKVMGQSDGDGTFRQTFLHHVSRALCGMLRMVATGGVERSQK